MIKTQMHLQAFPAMGKHCIVLGLMPLPILPEICNSHLLILTKSNKTSDFFENLHHIKFSTILHTCSYKPHLNKDGTVSIHASISSNRWCDAIDSTLT